MSKLRNPKYPCTQTPSLLAGGCYRGLVCWWDERAGGLAAGHSEFEQSHSDVVYTLRWAVLGAGRGQGTSLCCDRWIGKTGHEFFTGSSDGYIKWWDIRCTCSQGSCWSLLGSGVLSQELLHASQAVLHGVGLQQEQGLPARHQQPQFRAHHPQQVHGGDRAGRRYHLQVSSVI